MLGDSLKEPAAEAEAMISGRTKAADTPGSSSSHIPEDSQRTSLTLHELAGTATLEDEADAQDHLAPPEFISEEHELVPARDETPAAATLEDEATMESDTAVSHESLDRVRMLATRVKTGAPAQKAARPASKFDKFFAGKSRGYGSDHLFTKVDANGLGCAPHGCRYAHGSRGNIGNPCVRLPWRRRRWEGHRVYRPPESPTTRAIGRITD